MSARRKALKSKSSIPRESRSPDSNPQARQRCCVREAVDRFVRQVKDGLKDMHGNFLSLEMNKIPGEVLPRYLYLDQNPRLPVADDHKIHLTLELVAQVAEFETSGPRAAPSLDRLQQMTGNECLCAPDSGCGFHSWGAEKHRRVADLLDEGGAGFFG